MKVIKCDRCGVCYVENMNYKKTGIAWMDADEDVQGDKIDLCDDCIAALETWLSNFAFQMESRKKNT